MLSRFTRRCLGLWFRVKRLVSCRPRPKLVVKGMKKKKLNSKVHPRKRTKFSCKNGEDDLVGDALKLRTIRVASFNAALFSLAPAVPENDQKSSVFVDKPEDELWMLKQQASLCLPENGISGGRVEDSLTKTFSFKTRSSAPARSPICFPATFNWIGDGSFSRSRSVLDVLKELDADILALQDVKAEEEKDMKPLSDLARALDMNYVFADSWAPEYGNAILSRWPIKRWKVQKICDDKDFRNVVKATIDVPWSGDLSVYCTQLDHLDEDWRMKQVLAIIESNDEPHILAGGLNSLDSSDYSAERWHTLVKYYEELGKPTPKVEVTDFLKKKNYYKDASDFRGEFEPTITIAEGQNVQGTCKYGTRVDYILGSPGLRYVFVPGSYSVCSSKGTSDHHIVKVEVTRGVNRSNRRRAGERRL